MGVCSQAHRRIPGGTETGSLGRYLLRRARVLLWPSVVSENSEEAWKLDGATGRTKHQRPALSGNVHSHLLRRDEPVSIRGSLALDRQDEHLLKDRIGSLARNSAAPDELVEPLLSVVKVRGQSFRNHRHIDRANGLVCFLGFRPLVRTGAQGCRPSCRLGGLPAGLQRAGGVGTWAFLAFDLYTRG